MRPKSYSAVAWDTNSVSNIYKSVAGKWTGYASPTSGSNVALEVVLAKVLKYQKEYAQRAVPHAQKLRPPIEVVVAHYRTSK